VVAFAAPGIADGEPLTELARYRPTSLADLVVETADAPGVGRFAYVGWSWGASIGVHLGARHAQRLSALVLLEAGHTDIPGDPDRTLEDVLAELGERQERYRFDTWDDFFVAARQSRPNWRPALEDRLRAGMHETDRGSWPTPTAGQPQQRGTASYRSNRAARISGSGATQSRRSSSSSRPATTPPQRSRPFVAPCRMSRFAGSTRATTSWLTHPRRQSRSCRNGCGPDPSALTKLSWRRMAARRFSQAISEGDGISVLVEVRDLDGARAAESDGAEAIVVRARLDGIRDATELPILWRGQGPLTEAAQAGADACLLVVADHDEGDDRLAALQREALQLGMDCVVEVRDEDEVERALEELDPEIFLLAGPAEEHESPVGRALELLPDVPAGKLAVADVPVLSRDQVDELERAGVDAVIVGVRDVAGLVGDGHPPV
jgi:pimeloyl-ACP methyl ester carboxylesterase